MMQGANDFTPAWWEKRQVRLVFPPVPRVLTTLAYICPELVIDVDAIFCRACNEQTTPTRQGYECPTCGARVALCGNTRRGYGPGIVAPRCSKLAGHDGPCWEAP